MIGADQRLRVDVGRAEPDPTRQKKGSGAGRRRSYVLVQALGPMEEMSFFQLSCARLIKLYSRVAEVDIVYLPIPMLKLNMSFPSISCFCGVHNSPTLVLGSNITI